MEIGKLHFESFNNAGQLVASAMAETIKALGISESIFVASIDPELADTAAFCNEYEIGLEISSNCLVVEARRAGSVWYAACLVPATGRADINGVVRKKLGASKISFAPMQKALDITRMEYGGVTPIGLPDDWPVLVDSSILDHEVVIIGGGVRGIKIAIKTAALPSLPHSTVLKLTKD